jgi:transcriptional regulator with XRE-family HTH domain
MMKNGILFPLAINPKVGLILSLILLLVTSIQIKNNNMATLKELRSALGWTQSEVAQIINTNVSAYSSIENGLSLPCMEDCVILEKKFGQRIDWNENITIEQKAEIVTGIYNLAAYYPISLVLTFAQKALREGIRLDNPSILIKNYAIMSAGIVKDEEKVKPMPPTGIQFKEK